MTRMTIREDVITAEIEVIGHAGYNPGQDVVCAAISTMTYALINRLQALYDHGEINELSVVDDPGDIRIRMLKNNRYKAQWYDTRDFFTTGMEMIAEQYPDYLEVDL